MKKIIIVTLTILTMFTIVNSNNKVLAAGDDFTVVLQNTYSTYYVLKLDIDLYSYMETMTFTIPESTYHTDNAGGSTPELTFLTSADVVIETFDWTEITGGAYAGTYTLDFRLLDVYGAAKMQIIIPQTLTAYNSTYWNAMNNADYEITYTYDTGYDYDITYVQTSWYTRLEINDVEIPYNTIGFNINFDDILYYPVYNVTYNTQFILYNDAAAVDTLTIKNYIYYDQQNVYIDIPYDPIEYEMNDLTHMDIYVYIHPWSNHSEVIEYAKTLQITFNDDNFKNIIFISQNEEYASVTTRYNQVFAYPDDPTKSGYDFQGWYTIEGDKYDKTIITSTVAPDRIFYLYANYTISPDFFEPDLTEPAQYSEGIFGDFEIMLGAFNMNNAKGYLLVYAVLMVVIIFIMVKWQLGLITVGIGGLIIHTTFVFWGVLAIFYIIIGYLLFAYITISALSGGGVLNE